jgi:hypothetical protein
MDHVLALIRFDIFRFAFRVHIIAAATPHISPLFPVERAPIIVDELFFRHFLSSNQSVLAPSPLDAALSSPQPV